METVQVGKSEEIIREVNGKKLYKVLLKGESCHGGCMKWKVGVWYHFDGQPRICEQGFHLTTAPFQSWFKWGCDIYEAEAKGITTWRDDKCVCTDVRLIRKIPKHPSVRTTERFIKNLKKIPCFKPDGNPLPEWKLYTANTWNAAWAAALAAAGDAARNAAWNAALDAALDAALMAQFLICAHLPIKNKDKHFAHVKARMQVWEKGYGLVCDVDGVLYVYSKKAEV